MKIAQRIVGIDEAGYSPLLGPLVISAAVFETRRPPANWWAELGIPKAGDKTGNPLPAVDDSKKVYTPSAGLERLETAVLAFFGVIGKTPTGLRELLEIVGAEADTDSYPWYKGADVAIPVAADASRIEAAASRLSAVLERAGARFVAFHCSPILEGELNRRCARCGNKATMLLNATLSLAERCIVPGGTIEFLIDKQGGRDFYADLVSQHFFGCTIKEGVEGNDLSTYRIDHNDSSLDLSFCVRGDAQHLPIALASMLSKYIRELFMTQFNLYWHSVNSSLPHTSGYRTDGWKFVRALEGMPEGKEVPREILIRKK